MSLNKYAVSAHRTPRKRVSRFIGVSPVETKKGVKYRARYTWNKKLYHVGMFESEEDAARARDVQVLKRYKDQAMLNFPFQIKI